MRPPPTPYSEQAAFDAARNVGRYGQDISDFFGSMMAGGGRQDLSQILSDMDRQYGFQQQNMINQLKSSGIPLASSGMARAMGEQLGQAGVSHNIGRGMLQLDEMNKAMARQFQGAAGLSGMPSYYAQPSSIEQAMFAMRSPYDMARIQGLGNAYNNLWAQNYYDPTYHMMPSQADAYLWPWLGPLMQGLGRGLGSALIPIPTP